MDRCVAIASPQAILAILCTTSAATVVSSLAKPSLTSPIFGAIPSISKSFCRTPLLGRLCDSHTSIIEYLGRVGVRLHGRLHVFKALHQPKNQFSPFHSRLIMLLLWHIVAGAGVITTIASRCSYGMSCHGMSSCGFCLRRCHLSPSNCSTKSEKSPKRRFTDHRSCQYKVGT